MLMIQSLNTLITTLIATTTVTIILLFLPAVIELKKPKDAGPRLITDSIAKTCIIPLANIEEERKFDSQLIIKIASFLYAIPNLEV